MRDIKIAMQNINGCHQDGILTEESADFYFINAISSAISVRMREARANGKRGWWNPEVCSIEFLKEQAIKNLGEGNVLDAIIFSAMVLLRNEGQTNTLVFDTSTLGDLTELAPRHCAFFEDVYDRITQANLSFELATPTTKAIMIAGKMLEQTMKEIECLNPHKESSTGELSPAIENMIEDAGLEITDVKHIILAAQSETQGQMCTALDQSAGRFEKEIAGWEPTN
ncbi:hypothetical protein [Vibrio parahaemolyticus]|uniref:hypothetical protein n=1 Tax=Vibrio parahaemolyticus TaxID=670 RepID=UPI0004A7BD56|nr:hypothetical protein [Vibrio parahaemolyticus]